MYKLNQYTLDYSIPQELKVIQEKYQQLKSTKNLERQQQLYVFLVEINRQLPSLEEERDYLSSYQEFDR